MKKIIRLTEQDLARIVRRVINEESTSKPSGVEKPPYFKNLYGGIKNITEKNKSEVEKTMSRILKTPVKVRITEYPHIEGISLDSSEDEYLELYNETDKMWNLITIKNKKGDRRDVIETYSEGDEIYFIETFDPEWIYIKKSHKNGGNVFYYVQKQDGSMIDGQEIVQLKPGTKAYNSVKTKVFKD